MEADHAWHPTGVHRPTWLTKLRGYSRDLDWSVDNFKSHPRSLLIAIKDKLASKFEYCGGLGDVPEDVFFQILKQQMRTKRSNMKKVLAIGVDIPTNVKKQHVENFKKLIQRIDKIVESEWMKAARQIVRNESYGGQSEGEVILRLVINVYTSFTLFDLCDYRWNFLVRV